MSAHSERARVIAKKFHLDYVNEVEDALDSIDKEMTRVRAGSAFAGSKEQRRNVLRLRRAADNARALAASPNLPPDLRSRAAEHAGSLAALVGLCDQALDVRPIPRRVDGYKRRLCCNEAFILLDGSHPQLIALAAALYGDDDSVAMRSALRVMWEIAGELRDDPFEETPGQK